MIENALAGGEEREGRTITASLPRSLKGGWQSSGGGGCLEALSKGGAALIKKRKKVVFFLMDL